ncbi:MAG: hypothetical protein KDA79_08120 [Planctomycetaceae bacterium]|nr:hypothetical protein [Planctomycetaceae bacterium]
MITAAWTDVVLFAQQNSSGSYAAGKMFGNIFLAVLAAAILWKVFTRD